LRQSLAHGGTADAHPVENEGLNLLNTESARRTGGPQAFNRTDRIATVAKIMSNHHMPSSQALDDQFIDEAFRRHRTHVLVESQSHQAIDALRRQGNEFLAPTREPWRRALGIDELLGAWLKYQDRGRSAQFRGARFQHADHLLVAQVHAIVIAHGEYAALMSARNIVQTAN